MPFSWPSEALEAQAIAARTYALTSVQKGKPYHLYADVRDQVYRGVAGETERTNDAVRATAGKVVLYGGKLARTFYFSSSGGKTANAADVFGSPVPYLVSRPDPWDRLLPAPRWGPILLGARTVQSKFGVGARVVDAVGVPTSSGRLEDVHAPDARGVVEDPGHAPAHEPRPPLDVGERSASCASTRPSGRPLLGTPLTAHRDRARPAGAGARGLRGRWDDWSKVGPVSRDATGAFSIDVKPMRHDALPPAGEGGRVAADPRPGGWR